MFDAKKETNKIIDFIRNYYNDNNRGGVVIGRSGGKDSAVVAALFCKAIGPENVIGFTLPCHSNEDDKIKAKIISDYYKFELKNFDLTNVYDTIKPRLRMSTLYYMAALYTNIKNKTYIVAGTSNKCELYVGYFTKGGDSVHDISVLADLTVDEVISIGEELNVPKEVLYKAPSDGLSNLTDEEKLGVSYKDITSYINGNIIDEETKNKIKTLHNNSKHKFNIPTYKKI